MMKTTTDQDRRKRGTSMEKYNHLDEMKIADLDERQLEGTPIG